MAAVFAGPNEPLQNRLLAALPHDEYGRLLPSLQQISFSLGEVVYEFAGHLEYVFFPNYLNRVFTLHDGKWIERRNGVDR